MANSLPEAALEYARHGFRVFPLTPGGKKPPLIRAWPKRATTDAEQIRSWWERWVDANIAIVLGTEIGPGRFLAALDVDHSICDSLLEARPDFCRSLTRRGSHQVCLTTEPVPNLRLRRDVEVKGVGSYIVAPPSEVYGVTYRWAGDWRNLPVNPPEVPRRLAFVVAGMTWLHEGGGLPVKAPK